jgi:ADP-ribosylglycohydrolase
MSSKNLEPALWCFLQTDTFEAAILKAANLGDDADTTAAICGQVGGAYGESGIPRKCLERLAMRKKYRLSLIAYSKLVADGSKTMAWGFLNLCRFSGREIRLSRDDEGLWKLFRSFGS